MFWAISKLFIASLFMVSISFLNAWHNELYRPQLHYSAPTGWLSDPNGLVYKDGIFHLFHQWRPYAPDGAMHWGHAISTDLVHWKPLDTALYPPPGYAFFSGGGIFDQHNVSGLQTNRNVSTLIVYICVSQRQTMEQNVWMAYSNDAPHYIKFDLYERKPLMPNRGVSKYFRDPTPLKYKDHYVLVVSVKDRHCFYNSRNLIDWIYVSELGDIDGTYGGSWECGSLFPFNITLEGIQFQRYALTMTRTSFAQPIHQYCVGSFNGSTFGRDSAQTLWLDYGPDSFAGVVWPDMPDGRRLFINWMGRWEYAVAIAENVNNWAGQMGVVRELKAVHVGYDIRLTSYPIREIESLRTNHVAKKNITITKLYRFDIARGRKKKHFVDIEMTLDLVQFIAGVDDDSTFEIVFSGITDKLKISFKANEFSLDRSAAGKAIPNTHYAQKPGIRTFGQLWTAPRLITSPIMKLRIIIDVNCIEMFMDDGLSAMSALFYSDEDIASEMAIHVHSHSKHSQICLNELNVYEMKSIWGEGEKRPEDINNKIIK